jgi:Spy/CpxP family protein refolding chaperone
MLRIRSFQTAVLTLGMGLALAAAGAARGDHGPGMGMGGPGRTAFLERQLQQLHLPAQTQSSVDAVLAHSRTQQDALGDQIRAAHESMKGLLEQDTPDEAAVMAQADAIGQLMTQQRKNDLHTLIQVRSLLNPEQRAQLDQQIQDRRDHPWMGKRGGEGCSHGDAKPGETGTAPPADVQS